jgi:mediator of RNA polymerase II transcription subunit 1
MRLTYFVSPYDLLDEKTHSSVPLTVETVVSKSLGQSVEVCIEGSNGSHKLPVSPLITVSPAPPGGKR